MMQVDPYEELNINAYGVLKPPLLLWLIFLLETVHLWSTLLAVFTGQSWLLSDDIGWISLAVEIPSLLVLIALGARAPTASRIFRVLWHRGRELLTLAAFGNLCLLMAGAISDPTWRLGADWPAVLLAFLHLWALVRLWISPIIRMVFSEFPE